METVPMSRDETFNLRLDSKERQLLDVLAAHYGIPAANVLRMLVKEKHDWLTEQAGTARKKKP
jgi:hypothetical protein